MGAVLISQKEIIDMMGLQPASWFLNYTFDCKKGDVMVAPISEEIDRAFVSTGSRQVYGQNAENAVLWNETGAITPWYFTDLVWEDHISDANTKYYQLVTNGSPSYGWQVEAYVIDRDSQGGGTPAQQGYKDFLYAQGTDGSTTYPGYFCEYYEFITYIGYPVFTTQQDCVDWANLAWSYKDNPSAANLNACREFLRTKSKNPPVDDPNYDDTDDDDDEGTGWTKPGGGKGDHDHKYDPVPLPSLPSMGAVDAGFVTLYRLYEQQMRIFAGDLYKQDIVSMMKNWWDKPEDFIVSCLAIPFSPPVSGAAKPSFTWDNVTVGWQHYYNVVSGQYFSISCGDVAVNPFFGSCFDYSPYTKIKCWLPFIGYVDLNVDEIMGKTINVTYHIDAFTGDCIAFVSTGVVGETGPQIPRVLGSFSGNCAMRIPTNAVGYDSVINGSLGLIAGVAATIGIAAAGGAGIAAAVDEGAGEAVVAAKSVATVAHASSQLASSTISSVTSMKANVSKNGAMGGAFGWLGVKKPHLIYEIARQALPEGYKDLRGYPCYMGGKLGDFEGYTEINDIRLNNIPATEPEIEEIYKLLKGGIII